MAVPGLSRVPMDARPGTIGRRRRTTPNRSQQESHPLPTVTMKQLLESGVHFGHQTRRWNPKMKRYIFGERGGIYIIDLQQTIVLLEQACDVVRDISAARRHRALRRHQEAVPGRGPEQAVRAAACRTSRTAGSAAC